LVLARLRAAGVRPALIVAEVMVPFFNEPGPDRLSEEEWLRQVRLSALEAFGLGAYLARPSRMTSGWLKDRLLPGVTQRQPLADWLLPGWRPEEAGLLPTDERGWRPYPAGVDPAERARLEALAEEQYGTAFRDFRVGAGPLRALADLLADCRRDGVPVVLLLMPESAPFRAWGREATAAVLDRLDELPGGGERIDARDWVADVGFWDAHHLLPGGATEFSERLAAELGRRTVR
jgi:hypothetical protein